MNLSETMKLMTDASATDFKSINEQLMKNIRNCGIPDEIRQVSLQFNIWKQCIEQRQ